MIKSIKIEMDGDNSFSISDPNGIGADLLKIAVGFVKKEIDAQKPASSVETK